MSLKRHANPPSPIQLSKDEQAGDAGKDDDEDGVYPSKIHDAEGNGADGDGD